MAFLPIFFALTLLIVRGTFFINLFDSYSLIALIIQHDLVNLTITNHPSLLG